MAYAAHPNPAQESALGAARFVRSDDTDKPSRTAAMRETCARLRNLLSAWTTDCDDDAAAAESEEALKQTLQLIDAMDGGVK